MSTMMVSSQLSMTFRSSRTWYMWSEVSTWIARSYFGYSALRFAIPMESRDPVRLMAEAGSAIVFLLDVEIIVLGPLCTHVQAPPGVEARHVHAEVGPVVDFDPT